MMMMITITTTERKPKIQWVDSKCEKAIETVSPDNNNNNKRALSINWSNGLNDDDDDDDDDENKGDWPSH